MDTAGSSRERTFYVLIATQALSLIGGNVSWFAVSIWLFQTTGAATPLTLVGAVFVFAQICMSGIGGALADRYDRRRVMLTADCGSALASVALLTSFSSGAFELWHLYAVVVAQAIFGAIQWPAFSASITMLVRDDRRDRANAIQNMSGPAAGIVAPPLAGAMYAVTGVVGAIAIDLATFAVAAFVLLRVRIPAPPEARESSRRGMLREALEGFPYLAARPALLALCGFIAGANFLATFVGSLMTPYGLARTGSAAIYGIVSGVASSGAIIGSLVVARWGGTRPRIHGVLLAMLAFGLFTMLMGVGQTASALAAAWFAIWFSQSFLAAPTMSIFQSKVEPAVQGRVFAAMGQINALPIPISYLVAGPLADHVFEPMVGTDSWRFVEPLVGAAPGSGIGAMFVLSGIAMIAMTLTCYAWPTLRNVEAALPDPGAPAYHPHAGGGR